MENETGRPYLSSVSVILWAFSMEFSLDLGVQGCIFSGRGMAMRHINNMVGVGIE